MSPAKKKKNRSLTTFTGVKKNATVSFTHVVNPLQVVHNSKHDPSNIFNDWINFTTSFSQGIYNKL